MAEIEEQALNALRPFVEGPTNKRITCRCYRTVKKQSTRHYTLEIAVSEDAVMLCLVVFTEDDVPSVNLAEPLKTHT